MKDKTLDQEFSIDGTTIAPGVIETIISMAAAEVPGVAGVGAAGPISAIMAAFNSGKTVPTAGIKLTVVDERKVSVEVTIQTYYGYRLADVAANARAAIADALKAQIGIETISVDIRIDALVSEG